MNVTKTTSISCGARPGIAIALVAGLALLGCGGGGGGGGSSLGPPQGVVAFAGDGEVTLTWTPVAKAATYNVYWGTAPGVDKATGTQIADVRAPFLHTGLVNLQDYYYVVTSVASGGKETKASAEVSVTPRMNAGQFEPSWADVVPTQVIQIDYDPNLDLDPNLSVSEENGLALAAQVLALVPGDRLEIGDGVWTVPDPSSIDLMGTAMAPIWITGQAGTRPVITRADANDAVLHVGANGGARFLALIGLEIADGDRGLDVWDAQELWLDLNLISRGGNTPIAADNFDTQALFITRNQLDHAGGEGHGILLGTNDGLVTSMNSVIAQNQVSHCRGVDATGIWVRQGSAGNWIVENVVHDTDWPCILVAGTSGGPWNTIERNIGYTSSDNVFEIQSQAYVYNNLMIDGQQGFSSHDDFDVVDDLEVLHNTIINSGRAVNLDDWAGKNVVFANNVAYSQKAEAVNFPGGAGGVTFVGNVVRGPVKGLGVGFIVGNGLSDFEDVTWDGSRRDALPSAGSPIIDAADAMWHLPEDLTGKPRNATTLEAGCYDVP